MTDIKAVSVSEIEALRAQVAELQSVVARKDEALREIGSVNWHFKMSRQIANTALSLKASDVKAPSPDMLVDAVRKTLEENAHLADGDVCTLYDLREALAAYEQGKV